MTRVKRGNVARYKRKKILKFVKGHRGSQSRLVRISMGCIINSLKRAYINRK